ncbi:MAG: tetratricopeptide repeat protein [Saprospiraceae bacterium]|nr:tetratricopeptide repeat protein [Saprospiraceae bacterium]
MLYKVIFSGRLEFGNSRTYERVFKMFEHRKENYYRSEILLNEEEVFDEEAMALDVPRFIAQSSDKSWRNTINMLKNVAQYAIAGDINGWLLDEGKVVKKAFVEPDSDKAAVQCYLQGRKLVKEDGREDEAIEALNRAIEKFERHAMAYERRGFVNYQLKNFEDAEYDYSKSIDLNPNNPNPYYGRAYLKLLRQDWAGAAADFDKVTKRSIPHQTIYWKARRLKSECHIQLEQYKEAAFDLKLFTNRNFGEGNPNLMWLKKAYFDYGFVLFQQEQYAEAIKAFNTSLDYAEGKGNVSEAEALFYRGLATKKAGKKGFKSDLKSAAAQGLEKAAQVLAEMA